MNRPQLDLGYAAYSGVPKTWTVSDIGLYTYYQCRLEKYMLIASHLYKWEGTGFETLGVKTDYIERMLYRYGQLCLFTDPIAGNLLLPCRNGGDLDIYGYPRRLAAFGYGHGNQFFVDYDSCVWLRANEFAAPVKDVVEMYASRISYLDFVADRVGKQQLTPWIFRCNSKNAYSAKLMFTKMESGAEAIFTGKDELDTPEILQTLSEYTAPEMHAMAQELENELFNFLGVNNENITKRERVSVAEVEGNNYQLDFMQKLSLDFRQTFANEAKDMFSLDFTVEPFLTIEDKAPIEDPTDDTLQEEGEDSES